MAHMQASMFKDATEHGTQRESMVILYYGIGQPPRETLYAPTKHREMLEAIYKNMNVPVEWKPVKESPKQALSGKQSTIVIDATSTADTARIRIDECGHDTIEKVSHLIKELCLKKIHSVLLFLDLRDSQAVALVEDFEKIGFFFAGVIPAQNRQYLILQYLNYIRIDYSKISTSSDFTLELLAYVKALDPNQ